MAFEKPVLSLFLKPFTFDPLAVGDHNAHM